MSDNLDRMLRGLGEGTPFPIDWNAYEQEVLRRLAMAQRQERRRTWLFTIGGTLSGAAAMFVASVIWSSTGERPAAPERIQPAKADQTPEKNTDPVEPPPQRTYRDPASVATAVDEINMKPYTRRIVRKDGRVAEIRFEGFTAKSAAADESTFITVSDRSSH